MRGPKRVASTCGSSQDLASPTIPRKHKLATGMPVVTIRTATPMDPWLFIRSRAAVRPLCSSKPCVQHVSEAGVGSRHLLSPIHTRRHGQLMIPSSGIQDHWAGLPNAQSFIFLRLSLIHRSRRPVHHRSALAPATAESPSAVQDDHGSERTNRGSRTRPGRDWPMRKQGVRLSPAGSSSCAGCRSAQQWRVRRRSRVCANKTTPPRRQGSGPPILTVPS